MTLLKKTLIIGYGNPDRQDDGVAWHVLIGLAKNLKRSPLPTSFEEDFPHTPENPTLTFSLQLTPEIADTVACYERVCFVDAHTGSVPDNVQVETILPTFQASPFTHHFTPAACLYLVKTLYLAEPEALLVSVLGHHFGFEHGLSPETAQYALEAVDKIMAWLEGTGLQ
jgi:hydrogenase maturation protease